MKTRWKILRKDYRKLLRLARRTAKENYGREICGFLIDNGYFLHLHLTRNASRKRGSCAYYHSEVKELKKITKLLRMEIVGTFHSHPAWDAVPGSNDVKYALDDSLMLIFDCIGNEGKLWHIKNKRCRRKIIELI